MANLITKFKFYKSQKGRTRGNYLKYIATREGVEKIDQINYDLPATERQKELINKIIEDYPDSKEMLEFEDYLKSATVKNASEFITRAIEDNILGFSEKGIYADYIATRPRAEKSGKHGLFSCIDEEINLSKISKEISMHQGNMWTMIVSLRREDAERLGFNNAARWREFIRSKSDEIAEAFQIPLSDLKWYGAYHNETYHPHIHLIIYSKDETKGYLSKQGVNKLRSSIANKIFEDEALHAYEEKGRIRDEIRHEWRGMLDEIMKKLSSGTYENEEIQNKLIELSIRLNNTKAKKRYGYLKKDVKKLIDSIVDLLAEDEDIARLYDMWYEEKYKILRMYTENIPPKKRLSDNEEFKSLKNDIINEALKILENEGGNIKSVPPPKKKSDGTHSDEQKRETKDETKGEKKKQYQEQKKEYYESRKRVSATSVTRLFKGLANIFSNKLGYDDSKKLHVDKRLRKEIEDKKNAELTMT
ncbi:MAG: hypothetical protein IKJ13_01200 [Clostridia bacterium]|nr:hypothetical protein [Clostridia bacterium]